MAPAKNSDTKIRETAIREAQKYFDAKAEAIGELGVQTSREHELLTQLTEVRHARYDAYVAARNAGWGEDELSELGYAKRSKPRSKKDTATDSTEPDTGTATDRSEPSARRNPPAA